MKRIVLSTALTGALLAEYRCGGQLDPAPGETATFERIEICVRADIDIL